MPLLPTQTRRLNDEQLELLALCWSLLAEVTRDHASECECRLCNMCSECLVEDEERRVLEDVTLDESRKE
jgi:hypothetical protein